MSGSIVEELNSIDFDITWETLIPLLKGLLDSADQWMSDDYHTTEVLTILAAFRAVCERFGCDPNEHPLLQERYENILGRLVEWFTNRDSKGNHEPELYWQKLAVVTRRMTGWSSISFPDSSPL